MKKDWGAYSNMSAWRDRMNQLEGFKEITDEGLSRYAEVAKQAESS